MDLKYTVLIYISAGEVPYKNSLLVPQIISPAGEIIVQNIFKKVGYFCVIPILGKLAFLKNKTMDYSFWDHDEIDTVIKFSWLRIGGFFSFILKNLFVRNTAKQLIKEQLIKDNNEIIFHCRSYYATHIAIYIKQKLKNKQIQIIFDMRSLLPPEFVTMMGWKGKLLYGFAKEWEYFLLKNADLNLLVVKNGIQIIHLESPDIKIKYIPIQGFNANININDIGAIFEERWERRIIAYIGSLATWHSPNNLSLVINFMQEQPIKFDFIVFSQRRCKYVKLRKIKQESVAHVSIKQKYRGLLATIVSGRESHLFFEKKKISANFFSTKAAESLSMGVPLVVNKNIKELSDFVLKNNCGLVFEINDNRVTLLSHTIEELNNKCLWEQLTKNAFKVGSQFSLNNVISDYVRHYSAL